MFFLLAIFAPLLSVQNPFDPAQLQLINSRISPLWTADGQSPFCSSVPSRKGSVHPRSRAARCAN